MYTPPVADLNRPGIFDAHVAEARAAGEDYPLYGYTMIGRGRLDNIHHLLLLVENEGIVGDFVGERPSPSGYDYYY